MTIKLDIPNTPTIGVPYMRDGTRYMAVIKNPGTRDGVQMAMLAKGIGMSQIEAAKMPLKAIQPTTPVQHTYAEHQAAKYMAAMERR